MAIDDGVANNAYSGRGSSRLSSNLGPTALLDHKLGNGKFHRQNNCCNHECNNTDNTESFCARICLEMLLLRNLNL
jgi:hypothetical protein